jgi:predicted DNA-binding protein (MmcQ/YjbR family)
MTIEWVRHVCLALPHVTESVKWDDNLVFCVDDKMFAAVRLEPGPVWLSFKCSAEAFAELTERRDIRPAPYLARAQWVALETPHALAQTELRRRLAEAHRIVFSKLPKRRREALAAATK